MATILGDVTGLQQRHQPQNVPTLVEKIKGFLQKAKSFRNAAKYQKLLGGVPSSTPATPPPPYMYVPRPWSRNEYTHGTLQNQNKFLSLEHKQKERKQKNWEKDRNANGIITHDGGSSNYKYHKNQERIKGTEKASPIHTLFHR